MIGIMPSVRPVILQDFVSGDSATMIRNPITGGMTSLPRNRLPYVDKFKIVVIPDDDAALAALREGKIDIGMRFREAGTGNGEDEPEILQYRFHPA